MAIPFYIIDNFTSVHFGGNPAAVCILEDWPSDQLLLSIAQENLYSETAFVVRNNSGYHLRWFTPKMETRLCGHATMAAAYVLFNEFKITETKIPFSTLSGILNVERDGQTLSMDFPSRKIEEVDYVELVGTCVGIAPMHTVRAGPTIIARFRDQSDIETMDVNLAAVETIDANGLIVTAQGDDCDFVSRFFGPKVGMPEDPVTGSAHCGLVPFWAEILGKNKLNARQLSTRGGVLQLENLGDRVKISGEAVLFSRGEIEI